MVYKVSEVAEMAGITVRTLHHYDEIGLLKPEVVSEAGYRLYTERDIERLQQILFYKEMDLNLQEIKAILDSPGFDRKQALKDHLTLLAKKRDRVERLMRTVRQTLASIEGGTEMGKKELFQGFDMSEIKKHQETYAQEARERYGKEIVEATEARTSNYSKKDWADIMANMDHIFTTIATAMERGPSDPYVQEWVGRIREHITAYFYECTTDIFRGLGELYAADERFTANIDRYKPGLALFLRDAITIYCENQSKEA